MPVLHQVQYYRDALKQFRYGVSILYAWKALPVGTCILYLAASHFGQLCGVLVCCTADWCRAYVQYMRM